jgi:Spy/CpxP family protein refolding chaperone
MTRTHGAWLAGALLLTMFGTAAFAQTPPPATTPARGQAKPGGRAGRAGLPAITPNMNQQQLQVYMDAWAVVQARSILQLSEEQEPNFIARLQRIQGIRRRQMQEHRRIMTELVGLLNANPAAKAEDIDAHVKALQDTRDAEAADLRKAYLDIDAVLTPWQRGKFRQFEDQIERRKIELLTKIGGTAEPAPAPTPAPGAGRGRK